MITCSINNIEIVKALYSDVSGALKKAQDSKKDFDHNVVLPNGDVYLCCQDYGLGGISLPTSDKLF